MVRVNDESLTDDLSVYRRIPPERARWNENVPEYTKSNFMDQHGELSVYLCHETTPVIALAGHEGYGLIVFTLGAFRAACQNNGLVPIICRDDEKPENGHLLLCGEIKESLAKKIHKARIGMWVDGFHPSRLSDDFDAE